MKSHLIEILPQNHPEQLPSDILTLKPFVAYLKNVQQGANRQRQRFLSFVIQRIEARLGKDAVIEPDKILDYTDLWQLIYVCTNPILDEEHYHYWALSMPVSPLIFYCTDAFFKTIVDETTGRKKNNLAEIRFLQMQDSQLESCYAMILQRCYNIETSFRQELIFPFEEEGAGITRYFKIHFDDRFIDIYPKGELPPFPFDINNYNREKLLKFLSENLALDAFIYEGVCIIDVEEVTQFYALENIKQALLNGFVNRQEECYEAVLKSLQSLANSKDIEFGLFPLLKVNSRHIFNSKASINSLLIHMFELQGPERETYYFFGKNYLKEPKIIFIKDVATADTEDLACINTLKEAGVKSYCLVPIYFGNELCGVLEIYAKTEGLLKEDVLPKLEPALPYIAQIYQHNIDDFENEISQVIKQNFTSVQPAVQWKFNEVAWHYIRDQYNENNKRTEVEDIAFEQVFPLYGAVDLRNSTVERNEASRMDMHIELDALVDVLEELKNKSGFNLIDEKIFQCHKWKEKISQPEGIIQESRINEYLESEMRPFLSDFQKGNPAFTPIINRYYQTIDPLEGRANENKRQLEYSMNHIINAVNNYMELMKEEMQKAYPCYFEKFRTDGVEYDVYIGQSLAPEKPFSEIYLGNLRLMQLTSMAAITKYTHALQKELVKPIETTQLIFIHSHAIDILFRKDEKRFDVEGAYNIRYHIVKKRIDKVLIKGSGERLTVPGKIAMVYFSRKEADEYASYIHYLAEKQVLKNDLEYLELELLQGISGLKAMRVSVVLE